MPHSVPFQFSDTMNTTPPSPITPPEVSLDATTQIPTPLPQGVYVPTIAFFDNNDKIDISTTQSHAIRLANSGVSGLVVHGSNGEAVHLSDAERTLIISATRSALSTELDNPHSIPLIAGCGAQSTAQTLGLCRDAHKAGASHALVLPPAYYAGLVGREGLLEHFRVVAGASPIPLIIYNFPSAANGIDLTSDEILSLASHPNIVGVKLTCGNTGKLARVAASAPEGFFVAGGSADFILQGAVVGGGGTISGLANVCPKACVRIGRLLEEGKLKEARELQAVVARADWIAIQTGFVGVKAAMEVFFGYGGAPRLPCTRPEGAELDKIRRGFAEVVELEARL